MPSARPMVNMACGPVSFVFGRVAAFGGQNLARTSRTIGGPTQYPTARIAVRMNNKRKRNCGRRIMGAATSIGLVGEHRLSIRSVARTASS